MQILETDLPMIYTIDHDKINSLKKMMVMLCQSEPYDINISKLELNQRTLYKYLDILQSAGLIRILGAKSTGVSIISKPEKMYLDNINYPKSGDFILDEKYTFEIGGKDKSFKQLKDAKHGYIVADDIETRIDNKIPLWLFGLILSLIKKIPIQNEPIPSLK